jgi:hypothetical protein
MHEEHEVRYWTKHFGISREELQRAVNKVGNSATAARKRTWKIATLQFRSVALNAIDQ